MAVFLCFLVVTNAAFSCAFVCVVSITFMCIYLCRFKMKTLFLSLSVGVIKKYLGRSFLVDVLVEDSCMDNDVKKVLSFVVTFSLR